MTAAEVTCPAPPESAPAFALTRVRLARSRGGRTDDCSWISFATTPGPLRAARRAWPRRARSECVDHAHGRGVLPAPLLPVRSGRRRNARDGEGAYWSTRERDAKNLCSVSATAAVAAPITSSRDCMGGGAGGRLAKEVAMPRACHPGV